MQSRRPLTRSDVGPRLLTWLRWVRCGSFLVSFQQRWKKRGKCGMPQVCGTPYQDDLCTCVTPHFPRFFQRKLENGIATSPNTFGGFPIRKKWENGRPIIQVGTKELRFKEPPGARFARVGFLAFWSTTNAPRVSSNWKNRGKCSCGREVDMGPWRAAVVL